MPLTDHDISVININWPSTTNTTANTTVSATANAPLPLPTNVCRENGYMTPSQFAHALANGPGDIDSEALNRQWLAYSSRLRYRYDRNRLEAPYTRFRRIVEQISGVGVSECMRCDGVAWADELEHFNDGFHTCWPCFDQYEFCDECDEYFHENDHHDFEHHADRHSECSVPRDRRSFVLPGAAGPLASDTTHSIQIEATLSYSAQSLIRNTLWRGCPHHASWTATGSPERAESDKWIVVINDFATYLNAEPKWSTKDGNLTKRVRKFFLQRGLKLGDDTITEIGNLGRQWSGTERTYRVMFTRDLDGDSKDFYHGGSCWWTSYSSSMCLLKEYGGFAMMLYDADDNLVGRSWVFPVHRKETTRTAYRGCPSCSSTSCDLNHATEITEPHWRLTADVTEANAFVVFNSYNDDNDNKLAPRLLEKLLGKPSTDIDFHIPAMFINNDGGYLIGDFDPEAKNDIELNIRPSCSCPYNAG